MLSDTIDIRDYVTGLETAHMSHVSMRALRVIVCILLLTKN